MRWWVAASALLLSMVLTGCGSGQDEAVRERAAALQETIVAEDWAGACGLLAPNTRSELESAAERPCAEALAEEKLSVAGTPDRVDVFGTMAQVRYDGETLFWTRFADGWLLFAAGCTPQQPKPYDCAVHGG